ncbi:PGLYRP3.2 family protein, partial [Megaselia abdita]
GIFLYLSKQKVNDIKAVTKETQCNIHSKMIRLISILLALSLVSAELQLVHRSDWQAVPPSDTLDDLKHPVPNVIIMHTATEQCLDRTKCDSLCRFIQSYQMDVRKWYDIAYNFLVGGDGLIYEGRGWDKVGAHTKGFNSDSIGIAFIGTFNGKLPPGKSLDIVKSLLEEGLKNGKISPNYKLFGQRQLNGSKSPGDALYEEIKKWDHWSEKV